MSYANSLSDSSSSSSPYDTFPVHQMIRSDIDSTPFADQSECAPVTQSYNHSEWKRVLPQLRQKMYNSTSIVVPLPSTQYCQDMKKANDRSASTETPHGIYTDNILTINGFYSYRRIRSENLVYRMRYKIDILKDPQMLILRLTRGVFVHQKWQTVPKCPSPTQAMIDDYPMYDSEEEVPYDTFHLNNCRSLSHISQPVISWNSTTFVPYSYTFGMRFTNPHRASDILIRARLPLWCHNLFLAECMRQMPILPNETRYGLFVFAPHVSTTFRTMADCSTINDEPIPDLTLAYERMAMELSDPAQYEDKTYDRDNDAYWPTHRKKLLKHILFCDISDNVAQLLSEVANNWAESQGIDSH
ncbi:hypothetical protein BDF14DRAFT_1786801 [Spinellus fusiger]|nr:hypothetical protein BDF14DRAFT_1786801 [Spinellus fusiger]